MCPASLCADDQYYDFKSEIETKEQIRDHLGDLDKSVIISSSDGGIVSNLITSERFAG